MRRAWPSVALTIGLAIAIGIAFVLHARTWRFLADDAYISFRYATMLAEHGELVYNLPPLPRVEGYTNFLWVVLLAGLDVVGLEPHRAAPMLTQLSAVGAMVCACWLGHALRRRFSHDCVPLGPLDLVPAVLLVAIPEFMVWSHGGLETALAGALTLAAMAAFTEGRLELAGGLAALSALTRPDALLPVAVFGVAWLGLRVLPWRRRELGPIPWRRVALATLLFAGPLLAHLLWRRAFYGTWLPNTWTIKAHGVLLRDTYGRAYVEAWLDHVHGFWLLVLLPWVRPRHALTLLPIVAIVAYGWSVGGDFMAYSRFYFTATALLAVFVGWVLGDAARWAGQRCRPASARHGAVVLALAAAVGLAMEARQRHRKDVEAGPKWLDGAWEGVTAMHQFAAVGFGVGRWMQENLPPDTLITVGAAGALPYTSALPVIDAYGLVDPVVPTLPGAGPHRGKGARPGHQLQAPPSYIRRRDPDLLCHVGYRGPRPPSERRAHRSFARGYVWACIEPEPFADPLFEGRTVQMGVYCCRRPVNRPVGPFGGDGGA